MASPLWSLVRLTRSLHPEGDAALIERFAVAGDQAAFTELVQRHGPLVFGICRRGLSDAHLAEDAFQATFLVLARKARTLRLRATLDGWLFGVARRVVGAAMRRQRRRTYHEGRAGGVNPPADSEWDELLRVLDEELAALPAKYREPLIACFLRGRTQDEAARELGWSLSTLRRRLERGRELLKVRMTARGATLGAGLMAGVLAPSAEAKVPAALGESTVELASAIKSGGNVNPELMALVNAGGSTMSRTVKWSLVAAGIILIGGTALGINLAGGPESPRPTPANPPKPAAPEVKRDRFNDPLPPNAVARLGTVAFRHPFNALYVTFGLDGKRIVSTGAGEIRIWDASTGHALQVLGDRRFGIGPKGYAAGVSADGRTLLVSGTDHIGDQNSLEPCYRTVDLESGRVGKAIKLRPHPSRHLRYIEDILFPTLFAPAGTAMAGADTDGKVFLWDAEGNPGASLEDAWGRDALNIGAMAFTPDGTHIITGGRQGEVIVWNVATGARLKTLDPNADGHIGTQLAVSPDGKHVVAAAVREVTGAQLAGAVRPDPIRVWEIESGKLVRELDWGDLGGSVAHRLRVCFTPDGKSVVAADQVGDNQLLVRRWRLDDGNARQWTANTPNLQLSGMDIDQAGQRLVVGTLFAFIRVFDLATGKEVTPTEVHLGAVKSLAFSTDGTRVISAAHDGTARVWETASGKPLHSVSGLAESVAVTPDGGAVLSLHVAGKSASATELEVRDPVTGDVHGKLSGTIGLPRTHDGRTYWARLDRNRLAALDASTGATLKTIESVPGDPVALTPDGKALLIFDAATGFSTYDTATGKRMAQWDANANGFLRTGDTVRHAAFAPDGRTFAVTVDRKEKSGGAWVRGVCETMSGKVLWQESAGTNITGLAFHPDGKMIAVGGSSVKLIDAATGRDLTEFDGHSGIAVSLAFSRDGKRLASGGSDGNIMVWELPK